jgi:toxin ParE1/3/4
VRALRILPAAILDVEESALFYMIEANEAVATRFEEAVRNTFDWILENPAAGAQREYLSPRLSGLRLWPVRGFEKHLVFYHVVEESVEVVRVLHGARDIEGIFDFGR